MRDATTDVYKNQNFWNIVITVFLDVTVQNNSTPCDILAVLHIDEHSRVYNISRFDLSTNNEHIKSTILLKVPTVRTE